MCILQYKEFGCRRYINKMTLLVEGIFFKNLALVGLCKAGQFVQCLFWSLVVPAKTNGERVCLGEHELAQTLYKTL